MKRVLISAAACALALSAGAAFAQDNAAAASDPARLKVARATVDYIFPTGTYARIMKEAMGGMMDKMMEGVGKMPLRDIAAVGGVPEEKIQKLGDGTLKEIMAIYDPRYEERMQLTMRVMSDEMTKLMTEFEPAIREGLVEAYASRFNADQLGELNRFFATPTGTAYAADAMTIFMDPAVVGKMTEMMPAIMKRMPAIAGTMTKATASLPAPRKLEDLTSPERERLASLLGVPVDELGQQKFLGLGEAK